MCYTLNSNKITLSNGYSLDFEYPIKEVLIVKDVIIITVESPVGIIYSNNVFAIRLNGDFLWRIGEVQLYDWGSIDCPYNGAIVNEENELVLFNWCDTAVVVNPYTGEVIRTYQTK